VRRHLRLGPGGEFDRLRAIFRQLGPAAHELGDDCALLPIGGRTLAVSLDLSVEGVHFRTDWLTYRAIGWRAAAAALSDLAAEGADPLGVLVALGVPGPRRRRDRRGRRGPPEARRDPAVEIAAGVGAAAASVGARVLGGDLVRSARYVVDVCVLGIADRPVRRRGARPGDGLWVTGRLGAAGRALAALTRGRRPPPAVFRRFAHPEPRIAAGRWLARHGAHALIDISDGLAGDAGQLAAASGVRAEIALERVPCWPGVMPLAAARSGEEYELLAALPRRFDDRQARAFRGATGLLLTRIGWCRAGAGVRLTRGGRAVPAPRGFDHFPAR
jgi:thiamine-monophosphate kinase